MNKRILLATVSGLSVWPLTHIPDLVGSIVEDYESVATYVLVGGVFGVLVLVPLLGEGSTRLRRAINLMVGSMLIYALAVELASNSYGPLDLDYSFAIVTSGLLGALLVGLLTKFIVPLRTTGTFWAYLTIAGLFGGFLFSLMWESDSELISLGGYVAWQVSVCLALNAGSLSDS